MPTTFTDSLTTDPHLAFFSHDLHIAPTTTAYNRLDEKNATDDTPSDIEAFLEDMSKGPANVVVPTVPSPSNNAKTSPPTSLSKLTSPQSTLPPAPARMPKEFHFVANSDKVGAARVRNTLASRKHRQSKVNRIAELEKLLAEVEEERDMWKQRALEKS